MVIKQVTLETVCGITSTLPKNTLPEVAFAGRSNVGKSSLINALMKRKSLARTSAQPGKTQTINFYNINGEIYLVDLPGYGYARVSEAERQRWGEMIERYLDESEMLRAVFLLVDIRHAPSQNDLQMYEWIDYMGYQPIVVATKADKLTRQQVPRQMNMLRQAFGAAEDDVFIPFSSVTKEGLEDLWDLMDQVIENEALAADAPYEAGD